MTTSLLVQFPAILAMALIVPVAVPRIFEPFPP